MATHHGLDGSVKVGANTVAEVRSFEIEIEVDLVSDNVMTDSWATDLPGLARWTATAELLWDETDTNGQVALQTAMLAKTTVSLSLGPEGHTTGDTIYTGTAYVQSMGIATPHDGVVTRRCTFKGQGAPTTTTA